MSNFLTMVSLKDGSQVPLIIFNHNTKNLKALEAQNPAALFELVQKCRDVNYKFAKNETIPLLKAFFLLQENEAIHINVRNVVLNSFEVESESLKWVEPLESKNVSEIGSKTNK